MEETILSERQFSVIKLLCSLDLDRTPKVEELCELLGICSGTYYRWFRDPEFISALNAQRRATARPLAPLVDRAVAKRAIEKSDVNAARLFYEREGELSTQTNVRIDIGKEELRRIGDELACKISRRPRRPIQK